MQIKTNKVLVFTLVEIKKFGKYYWWGCCEIGIAG